MRGPRSTLVLVIACAAIGGYAYFIESARPSRAGVESMNASVFSLDAGTIHELQVIASSGEQTSLRRIDGAWRLLEPVSVDADEAEVSGITTGLASVEIQRVVDDAANDLEPFGLAEPRIGVAFKTAGAADFTHLLIGDQTATGGDVYAKRGDVDRVFLIPAYLDSSFDRTPFDLRDKSILNFARDAVDRLDLTTDAHSMDAVNLDDEWRITEPWEARAEFSAVEGLVGRLATAHMASLSASEAPDLAEYGLDAPQVTATVSAGSATATLEVGRELEDGTVFARDVARPLVFTVEGSLVDDLRRPPSEFRRQDVFAFRAFNARRLEVIRDGKSLVFDKPSATEGEPTSVWRQVEPSAGEVDQATMSDLLSKLSNLRADAFIDSRDEAGLDAPVATISVWFGEDEEERVEFGRSGQDVYAGNAVDAGAARIDATEFDAALALVDTLR